MSFLDKFKKGVAEAGTLAKVTVEVNRLKLQISNKRKEIQEYYLKIGEAMFQIRQEEESDAKLTSIDEWCAQILSIQADMKDLELKIKELSNEKTCACGKVLPLDAKFCVSCGHKFEEVIVVTLEPELEETATCPSCHQSVQNDAKFCGSCGYTLS
ncbi:zinc ribbon domain-containing protein [Paenibacillus terrigena]|uniref:zinc ribbon domain-containing protein n=1 Tax=Paenibacillus terrigena TaxID=369333 RepID=UPI00037E4727|nr:zinc ribbon domain-containing protein [Paenibacillus terrigena]